MKSRRIIIAFTAILSLAFTAKAEEYKYEGLRKGNDTPPGTAANCTPATAATELDINNTRALIQSGGDMWWDFNRARYEIPQGSEKTSLFAGSLWLAGQDVSGQFKVAALRFRQVGNDYWTGPLSTVDSEIDPATCKVYDRHWETTRSMVSEFAGWYAAGLEDSQNGTTTQEEQYPGYTTPAAITEWPAHGRNFEPYNEDYYLAPFFDFNGDGDYNPDDGDYPGYVLSGKSDCSRRVRDIYGDQNIWWVFNDKGNIHSESGGQSIGMEIRAQAFAFATTDEVNNMTFYNYELINRSTFNLTDTYFGQWVDPDLGNAQDDFVGCDVRRGLGYVYNGDDEDQDAGGNIGYGTNPPALGVDFFQGPFAENDSLDNCLCEGDLAGAVDSAGIVYPGQGAGYGDGIVDNERYGMRKFLYHNNAPGPTGDPNIATDYYNMLRGVWRDGTPMTYGGNGYDPSNANAIPANYMFPGDTDPLNWGTNGENPGEAWTEVTAGNPAGDRRFVQSSGPFELGPGAVNNITVGVVWAQAQSGGRLQSVEDMRKADDKTQALFDSCFEILDGPNSPDVTVQELDREVILMLENPINSNNYQEKYAVVDPFLPAPDSVDLDGDGNNDIPLTERERELYSTYVFEGYQIYQLADGSVGTNDLEDPDKARLVAQVDIANDITRLVNYEYDPQIDADVPELKVDGLNEGIEHSFQFTEDVFATGDSRLINHKTYYYMAVAYAYNQYGGDEGNLVNIDGAFEPSADPPRLDGQKIPYLASRTSAAGPVKVYEAIPHKTDLEFGGVELNAQYGDGVELTRVEGRGNGGNFAIIKEDYIDEAVENAYVENMVYEAGAGPVLVKVVDPLVIPSGDFTIAFKDSSATGDLANMYWEISGDSLETVTSDQVIKQLNEQVLFELGLSVSIQYGYSAPRFPSEGNLSTNNGFIGFDVIFEDETDQWLVGLVDIDADTRFNWIKSGTSTLSGADPAEDDHFDNLPRYLYTDDVTGEALDPDQIYENIAGRTWSPFSLASYDTAHPIPLFSPGGTALGSFSEQALELSGIDNTPGVDIVITTDCSKWTRCPVLEAGDNGQLNIGGAVRGELRRSLSVDKSGRNQLDPDFNEAEGFGTEVSETAQVLGASRVANMKQSDRDYLLSLGFTPAEFKDVSFGMGWFPGYAINVETGERLNMAFSEDSWLGKENGADMIWNPTDRVVEPLFGELRMGGKHMTYVFRHNTEDGNTIDDDLLMPAYNGDGGTFAFEKMIGFDPNQNQHVINSNSEAYQNYMSVMRAGAWVGYPMLAENFRLFGEGADSELDCDGNESGNDVTIRLRATQPYRPYAVGEGIDLPGASLIIGSTYYVQAGKVTVTQTDASGNPVATTFGAGDAFEAEAATFTLESLTANVIETVNDGLPLYTFNTESIAPTLSKTIGQDKLSEIKAVPNPYYAYSEYETGRLEYLIKVINLPQECTINIFTVNGVLVRTFEKDDPTSSSIDWDLKNQDGIPIASGLYIIHVNAPGLGETVLKWFGVLRPIDLNSF
jgi:hypothetical protein